MTVVLMTGNHPRHQYIVVRRPRTMAEFLDVSGVGDTKAERYGEEFLKVVREQSVSLPESSASPPDGVRYQDRVR